MKKNIYVVGNTDNSLFDVCCGKVCKVIKDFFYNGETWYKLQDLETKEYFDSPTVFWNETKMKG